MGGQQLIMIGLMVVIFIFFFIRPENKKRKAKTQFRNNLKAGDKVVTIGGVHGKILEVTDTTVLLSSEGTKIRFSKAAISDAVEENLPGA